jgi:hypothetical protein
VSKRRGITAVIAVAAVTAAAGAAAQAEPGGPDARTIQAEAQLAQRVAQLAASPRSATAAGGHALGGFTVQGWPVVLEISGNAKRVELTVAGLTMRCSSGARFGVAAYWQQLSVARNGRVRAARTIPPGAASQVSVTGGSRSFDALLNRRRATIFGAWRLHVDYRFADGSADHCDSGLVGFAARL